ncbi:DUF742 domain-containing protein [Streptacidiphilus fuscans]|uniref:DUF742 domain-containing protein n=1 Tax=Streptacidiphilus fuscans TaxID=2789292 RepID=A0A931BE79_9ACTN|nr:DUF742 domain-containing protein [Streptacidiphilus fuscans]MBF9071835.1 DUF742 domain-containing protein [Streptacidiphilus fuscans]
MPSDAIRHPATGHDLPVVWAEQDTQDMRPYAVTGGRTRPRHALRLVTLLTATGNPVGPLGPEAGQLVELCQPGHRSIAELAGVLRLPVQVVKVLTSDLIDARLLRLVVPAGHDPHAAPTAQLLEATLAGLRRKWPDVA